VDEPPRERSGGDGTGHGACVAKCGSTKCGITKCGITEYRVTEYRVTEYRVTEYRVTKYWAGAGPQGLTAALRRNAVDAIG